MILRFVVVVTALSSLQVRAIPQRHIYTIHPTEKTWNQARDICEHRLGQLVKIEDKTQEEELLYLGRRYYELYNITMLSNFVWTGNHISTETQMLVYQDCLNSTTTISAGPVPNKNCVSAKSTSTGPVFYEYKPCSNPNWFICQRTIGDCWYRPYEGYTVLDDSSHITLADTEATACALQCRALIDAGHQCWAFSYYPKSKSCVLHFLGEAKFNQEPSVTYLLGDNDYLRPEVDTTLYLKICFEGELDINEYESYVDTSSDPDVPSSACSTTDPDPSAEMCFCESRSEPPIPEPIPMADKIQEIVQELTVAPSNTSAAIRKKICAEDNRPSAIGVGAVGVGMMVTVFGGLILLDAQVLFQGIKEVVNLVKGKN